MRNPKDIESMGWQRAEPLTHETDPLEETEEHTPAGRIVHDDRGNAVWKWAGDLSSTGTSSGILKHLDPGDLNVEGQGEGFSKAPPGAARSADAGGGYDPYNQSQPRIIRAPNKGSPRKR